MGVYRRSQHMALLDEQADLCLMLTLAKAAAGACVSPHICGIVGHIMREEMDVLVDGVACHLASSSPVCGVIHMALQICQAGL